MAQKSRRPALSPMPAREKNIFGGVAFARIKNFRNREKDEMWERKKWLEAA
jgi:hypothetical protein